MDYGRETAKKPNYAMASDESKQYRLSSVTKIDNFSF